MSDRIRTGDRLDHNSCRAAESRRSVLDSVFSNRLRSLGFARFSPGVVPRALRGLDASVLPKRRQALGEQRSGREGTYRSAASAARPRRERVHCREVCGCGSRFHTGGGVRSARAVASAPRPYHASREPWPGPLLPREGSTLQRRRGPDTFRVQSSVALSKWEGVSAREHTSDLSWHPRSNEGGQHAAHGKVAPHHHVYGGAR